MKYRTPLLIALLVSAASTATYQEALAAPKKATAAKAEKEAPRLVAVGPVTGPMQFSVRQWLSGALESAPDQFALVDDGKSKAIAGGSDEKALAGFAKKNKAKVIIVGAVKKTPKGYSLTVTVHGPDGVEMDGVEFEGASAAKLKKSVESSLVTALQGVLGMGAAAPAAAAPADGSIAPEAVVLEEDENAAKTKKGSGEDEEPASEEALPPAEEEPKKAGGLTPLKLEVGGRARSRSFAYTDPLDAFYASQLAPPNGGPEFPVAPVASTTDTTESGARYPLSNYSLVYPGFFIGAEWYPGAHFTTGIPTYFGFVGNYQKDAIATTTAIGEDVISTASFSYFAGLKVRLPLGKHQVAAFGGIGEHAFDVGTENNDFVDVIPVGNGTPVRTASEITVPSTDYKYLRVGAEGTVNLEPLAITAGFAARLMSATGELQDPNWFPGATAQGWDASLKGELPIFELGGGPVSLEVGVDFTRYAWAANSLPEDVKYARVAGGGVDNYVSGWLGVSYALGGSGGDVSVKGVTGGDDTAPAEGASSDDADESSDEASSDSASNSSSDEE